MPKDTLDRDQQGRFAPGNTGGPARPRRRTEADYLAALSDQVPLDAWSPIVGRAVGDAIAGDAKAREWLPKYLLPTPTAGATLRYSTPLHSTPLHSTPLHYTPLHDGAVQALSGISKVEDDAETAMMHRVTLQALRMLP